MRDIKFRAWDIKEKKMIPWEQLMHNTGNNLVPNFWHLLNTSWIQYWLPLQYTGLKDKNGKEIYEGDIVKVPEGYAGDNYHPERIAVIEYDLNEFIASTKYMLPDFSWYELEVIGNIYENPELCTTK